jgi:hypothetical protein
VARFSLVRVMFATYVTLVVAGIVLYTIVGLRHL